MGRTKCPTQGGDRLSPTELAGLPWAAINSELVRLAAQDTRRFGLPRSAAADAAQEACSRMCAMGAERLPAILLCEDRGRWLRVVLRNVLGPMSRHERRWRGDPQRATATRRQAGRAERPEPLAPSLLARLPISEAVALTLMEYRLTWDEIAVLERVSASEIARRAYWGATRLREPSGSISRRFGRIPGTLASLRGEERRTAARMLARNHWPSHLAASEFRVSLRTYQRLCRRD